MDTTNFEEQQDVNLKDQVYQYLKYWPWFLLSAIVFVVAGFIYLRYATNQYQATAKIVLKDAKGGGGLSELSALDDLNLLGSSFNTVENEVEILHSYRLIRQVVHNLDLNVVYSQTGRIKASEVYKQSPVTLTMLDDTAAEGLKTSMTLVLEPVDATTFKIKSLEADQYEIQSYGAEFAIQDWNVVVVPNHPNFADWGVGTAEELEAARELFIAIHPIRKIAESIKSRLSIETTDERSSVLELSITDPVKEKAEDLLNNLVMVYNQDANKDINEVAQNTAQFIEERLVEVQKDLDSLERGIQRFKTSENLTDLVAESEINLQFSAGLGREVVEVATQLKIAKLLQVKLQEQNLDFIPENVGLENLDLQRASATYNVLIQEYLRFQENATSDNPVLRRLATEIASSKEAILLSLDNVISAIQLQQQSLNKELNKVSGKISDVPENERVNRDIERERVVVESVYLLLIQKKETTAISLAVTAPKAKVVDFAMASLTPVSPKSNIIYLATLLLGLLLPGAIIYVRSIFYNKIESRRDLERKLPNTTILGEIPKIDQETSNHIQLNDRSIAAESFRIIRTNLQYKLNAVPHDTTKVVLVTSTIKGEGKTLASFNLANTFAYSGKKVLLIGGDIRNPQLHRYYDQVSKRTPGVTEFLTDDQKKLKELTFTSDTNANLDLLLSGAIPPNPAELWMQDRTTSLFDEAKEHYDLVIIDSAPTILVTDTLLISKYADVVAYVVRANYTDKDLLEFIANSVKEGKLTNIAFVLNNVKMDQFGYGSKYGYKYAYKYGYAYGEDRVTFWEAWKNKLQKKGS